MARTSHLSEDSFLCLVERCVRSEMGMSTAGSQMKVIVSRDFRMDAWSIQLRVGRYSAGVMIHERNLEACTVGPEVYVRHQVKALTRAMIFQLHHDVEREIDADSFSLAEVAEIVFEETGILIGGNW